MVETDVRKSLANRKILVVDDVEDNLSLFRAYLNGSGATVDGVQSGEVAIDTIRRNEYDVVIMDLQMPGMDGWKTASEIRAIAFDGYIVACSAYGGTSREFWTSPEPSTNFNGYLAKPCSRQEFLACIVDICG